MINIALKWIASSIQKFDYLRKRIPQRLEVQIEHKSNEIGFVHARGSSDKYSTKVLPLVYEVPLEVCSRLFATNFL